MEPSVQSGPIGEPRSNLSALLTVLDTIGALIFTKDRRGIYTYANQRFAEVVGLAPPDVPGRRTAELFDPDTARELDETDSQVLASGQTVEQREYRVTRGGAHRSRSPENRLHKQNHPAVQGGPRADPFPALHDRGPDQRRAVGHVHLSGRPGVGDNREVDQRVVWRDQRHRL